MHRRRRYRRRRREKSPFVFIIFILAAALIGAKIAGVIPFPDGNLQAEEITEKELPPLALTEEQLATISAISLNSQRVVLMTADGKTKLLDRGGQETMYPASMTKIMTALVAIEKIGDLETPIVLSPEMFRELEAKHASMAGFSPGETVTARDLIYGAMMPSGAECTQGLAEYIAGSEEAFAGLMNQKAQELGMSGTHFVNASGLHSDTHYSTADDIALLLQKALENDQFRRVITTRRYTSTVTEAHPEGLAMRSSTLWSLVKIDRTNVGIQGGKTGYTPQAGLCLASFMQVNGREYILVTAGAPGSPWSEPLHIKDACIVYDLLDQMKL